MSFRKELKSVLTHSKKNLLQKNEKGQVNFFQELYIGYQKKHIGLKVQHDLKNYKLRIIPLLQKERK